MIISINGGEGAGKTTVAKRLAKELGYKHYYMGSIRRKMAKEKGMTIEEYNKLGETNPSTDRDVEDYQEKLGKEEDNFVIEGRVSFHFIPHSFKIYIDVDPKVGAERIFHDVRDNKERNEKVFDSVEGTMKDLVERRASDERRYMKYYGLDCHDKSHYDYIIDTTNKTIDEVFEEILEEVKKRI